MEQIQYGTLKMHFQAQYGTLKMHFQAQYGTLKMHFQVQYGTLKMHFQAQYGTKLSLAGILPNDSKYHSIFSDVFAFPPKYQYELMFWVL